MAGRAELDLLLINPGGRKAIYQDLGADLAAIETPVWAGLMATFVRGKGYEVDILDSNALNLDPAEVAEAVKERAPRLTAVVVYGHQPSASTQMMPSAGAIARAVKETVPETKVLLVGGHAAALPERTLEEEGPDFVASGEGLYTLVELLEATKVSDPDFHKVRGLCFMEEGRMVRTSPAPLLKNLDEEMPGMAWDLFPMDRYRAHNWHSFGHLKREPYAALYTTLGCPYKCSFCCIQAPFKEGEKAAGLSASVNSYRRWNPKTVADQLDVLVNRYGVYNVKFADEMFVLHKGHIRGLCEIIIERGYDLNIWAYARVDTIQDDMPEMLKQAGVNWLILGIEAANETVRDGVEKGYGQGEIRKAIDKCHAAGIHIMGNYIFGLPDDDLSTMQETLDLALDLNCEFANFYSAMAYPGSALYDMAVKEGWELPHSWSGYSQHSADTLPLPTRNISAAEVLRFRDQAFQTYFSSPAYLAMMREKFGEETVRHIEQMASHTLERNYA